LQKKNYKITKKGSNAGDENSNSLISKVSNNKKKKNKNEIGIVIDEDYEEEKNNEENVDMCTDDEEAEREKNNKENVKEVKEVKETKNVSQAGNDKTPPKVKSKPATPINTSKNNSVVTKEEKKGVIDPNLLGKKRKVIKKK